MDVNVKYRLIRVQCSSPFGLLTLANRKVIRGGNSRVSCWGAGRKCTPQGLSIDLESVAGFSQGCPAIPTLSA